MARRIQQQQQHQAPLSNKSIKSDAQFAELLEGYTEVTDARDLQSLMGARVRYKMTHYRADGSRDVQYRLGGALVHVDRALQYIRLKNTDASSNGNSSFGGASTWSVQLQRKRIPYQEPRSARPTGRGFAPTAGQPQQQQGQGIEVPIVLSFHARTNVSMMAEILRGSNHGVFVLELWTKKPVSTEVQALQALLKQYEAQSAQHAPVPSSLPAAAAPPSVRATPPPLVIAARNRNAIF